MNWPTQFLKNTFNYFFCFVSQTQLYPGPMNFLRQIINL